MGLKRHKELAGGRRFSRNDSARGRSSLKPMQFSWAEAISAREWKIYRSAIRALRNEGIEFLVGGGFARAGFTGRWRDTKDIDFYIRPQDRQAAERALKKAGFADYYEKLPYDRAWIYRSNKQNVIVDVIWAMANQRAQVDDLWLTALFGVGTVYYFCSVVGQVWFTAQIVAVTLSIGFVWASLGARRWA